MLALILSNDAQTRRSVRKMVAEIGFSRVFAAETCRNALAISDSFHARLRLVIVDEDIPDLNKLLRMFAADERFARVPIVALRRRGATAPLDARIDVAVRAPFHGGTLAREFAHAADLRAKFCSEIVVLGDGAPGVLAGFRRVTDLGGLTQVATELGGRLGAIVVTAAGVSELKGSWLTRFEKSPIGKHVRVLVLSRNATLVHELRSLGHFFFEATEFDAVSLAALKGHMRSALVCDLALNRAKGHWQAGNMREAYSECRELLRLDGYHREALSLAGDCALAFCERELALKFYRRTLALNPCVAHCYLKICLSANVTSDERRELLTAAKLYCPNVPEVRSLIEESTDADGDGELVVTSRKAVAA